MKKLFYRPKSAQRDYTLSMLPKTRKEVFFDVLKLNWKSFLLYGLLLLAFSLPLQLVELSESMAGINLQNTDAGIPPEQIPYITAMTRILAALVKLPCFLLLAVGISGFARVIRQYAWMENVNFWYEFKRGIKGNVGQMLLLALIAGIANLVIAAFAAVADTGTDMLSSVILLIPAAILILCFLPVLAYMPVSICLYNGRFGSHFHIGRIVYSHCPWKTLLALLCCLAPFMLRLLPGFLFQIIAAVLAPMLLPVILLGWHLFALNGLDKYINPDWYPALVGKGLYDPESDTQESSI